jgi:hypothetical protein
MRRSASVLADLARLVAIVTLAACGAPPAASPAATSPPLAKTARATDVPLPPSAPGSSIAANAGGAERASGYDQPPQAVLDVLRAPSPPRPYVDLFRAGIATSGSYNKTLTPFGFQNERRSVWEAQRVYLEASPFFFADKLKLPLLLVHGADDANPGTTPLQASKLYEAVRGNGGTARLVMLPHEPHWYASMESNEQLAFEMIRWFDRQPQTPQKRAKITPGGRIFSGPP